MSLVLYRKYRPQNFSDIFGQERIVQTISNSILSGRVAHAYLFCGPRGTGKTTMARLLAKAVNCEKLIANPPAGGLTADLIEPCNKCHSCLAINEGNSLDVVEIDAASNRGINEIRDLRESVQFSPSSSKYKVFIIDEVHMLTKEAFNALLKTLEEPPAHIIFVLATTESGKVPATIISRCQRFDFRKITNSDIAEKLKIIAKKEGIKVGDDVLQAIAALSDGGLRDAESLMGQIISVSGEEIDLEAVKNILGVGGVKEIAEFADLIASGNAPEVFKFINNFYLGGKDMAEFLKLSSNYFRKMMICRIDGNLLHSVAGDMTPDQRDRLLAQSQKFADGKIQKIVSRFLEAESQLKKSSSPIIPLELAIVDILGL